MATKKITVTLPEDLLERTRDDVAEGKAENVSAYVSAAIARFQEEEDTADFIASMTAKGGRPTEDDEAWARQAMGFGQ